MSIIATLTTSLTLSDGATAWAKSPVITANTGSSETYTQPLSVGTSPVSVILPLAAVQVVQIRNLAPIGISAPVAAPILSTIAGTLGATTYYVKVTYVNAMGETTVSAEATIVAGANTSLVISSPPALGSATGWNVYIANTSGGSGTETLQNASPIAIGTSHTQSIALVGGASVPGSNTTAAVVSVSWTVQGGASEPVIDLWPGGQIAFGEPTSSGGFNAPSAIGGVTAISLQSSIAATPVEVVVAG